MAHRPPRIYVAGAYSAPTREEIERNINVSRAAAAKLMTLGYLAFSPHAAFDHFDSLEPSLTYDRIMSACLHELSMCQAILMLPGSWRSPGATVELKYAQELGLPVYKWPDMPEARGKG